MMNGDINQSNPHLLVPWTPSAPVAIAKTPGRPPKPRDSTPPIPKMIRATLAWKVLSAK